MMLRNPQLLILPLPWSFLFDSEHYLRSRSHSLTHDRDWRPFFKKERQGDRGNDRGRLKPSAAPRAYTLELWVLTLRMEDSSA